MNSAVDKGFSIAFINTALSGLLHYSFVLGNNVFFSHLVHVLLQFWSFVIANGQ